MTLEPVDFHPHWHLSRELVAARPPIDPLLQIRPPVIDRVRNLPPRARAPANTTRRAPSAFEFAEDTTRGRGRRRPRGRPRGSRAGGERTRGGDTTGRQAGRQTELRQDQEGGIQWMST